MKLIKSLAPACLLVVALPALADERPDHFKGKPAGTVEQAIANLNESHPKLEALVEKDSLSPQELHEIHVLTYTLENALETLRAEHARLAEVLEEVHLASESADSATVKRGGREYLELAEQLLP